MNLYESTDLRHLKESRLNFAYKWKTGIADVSIVLDEYEYRS